MSLGGEGSPKLQDKEHSALVKMPAGGATPKTTSPQPWLTQLLRKKIQKVILSHSPGHLWTDCCIVSTLQLWRP